MSRRTCRGCALDPLGICEWHEREAEDRKDGELDIDGSMADREADRYEREVLGL